MFVVVFFFILKWTEYQNENGKDNTRATMVRLHVSLKWMKREIEGNNFALAEKKRRMREGVGSCAHKRKKK